MGFQSICVESVPRFSYKFEIFAGASDNVCAPDELDLGASSNAVVTLVRHLPEKCNYKFYVDNWLNSIG